MKPTIHFAADHAGYALKQELVAYVRDELGYEIVDHGAELLDPSDNYPEIIARAAAAISETPTDRAIVLGGSGQGEAMVANRFKNVRAAVFYGEPPEKQHDVAGHELSMIASVRQHNDSNILSLGARFLDVTAAKAAIAAWLSIEADTRHAHRIAAIEQYS